jgi:peptidyl-prolyl cis-trans isomerase B (cyclophilin B)
MSAITRLLNCGLLLMCLAAVARGQEAAPPRAGAQDAPAKKANSRPASEPADASEPFDRATPAQMSAQCVRLETEAGVVELEMLAEAAPETVRNFLNLAATGAYDTTTFTRVVKGFIIQGGDLATRERALTPALLRRAGRTLADEPNPVKHARGVVSMARTGDPHSATTHFFILVGPAPHLDGTFAAFARVRAGMEVVDLINQAPADGEKPDKPVRLTRATVAPCAAQSN